MKILIYGEDYWYGLAAPLRAAFETLGHKVDLFCWTAFLFKAKRASLVNRVLDRLLGTCVSKKINKNFQEYAKKDNNDLILVLQGKDLFPETILSLKDCCERIINWNIDDFFNPLVNTSKYKLSSFGKYDCIYSPRKHLFAEYFRRGAKRLQYLKWFYYPEKHYPVAITSEEAADWGSDIAFIGTWSRYREEVVGKLEGLDLKIWGGYWHRARKGFRKNFNIRYRGAWFEEMSKVANSSKIVVDVLTKENMDQTNLKTFQIPACGGFLLTKRTDELLELFEEDREIVCYETPDELRAKCEYYLAHESERMKIARNAHRKIINGNHTLLDRAKEILRTISD